MSQYSLFHVTMLGIIQLLQTNRIFIKIEYKGKETKQNVFYKVTKYMYVANPRIKLKNRVLQNLNSNITQFVTFAIYKFMRHNARGA